jgi:hypothetical protein
MSTATDFFTTGDTRPIIVTLPAADGAGNAVDLTTIAPTIRARLVAPDRSVALTSSRTIGPTDPGCDYANRKIALAMPAADTQDLVEQKAVVEIEVNIAGAVETFWSSIFSIRKGLVV